MAHSNASIIIVDDDHGSWADYHTLGDAINSSTEGDEILVYPGMYFDSLDIRHGLSIIGNSSDDVTLTLSGSGISLLIQADNTHLSGLSIDGSQFDSTIMSVDNVTIDGCNFSIEQGMLHIWDSTKVLINNSNFLIINDSNSYITFQDSDDIRILNCNLNCWELTLLHSSNVNIQNTTIYNARDYGIILESCDNTIIDNCTVINSTKAGILYMSSNFGMINECMINENGLSGIILIRSSNLTISHCFISHNEIAGIDINTSSNGNEISKCVFRMNDYVGIVISSPHLDSVGKENFIHHNTFGNNNAGGKQARDLCESNKWDDGSEGNSWSDHFKTDDDVDGIVDEPYVILGDFALDHYPFVYTESYQNRPIGEIVDINPNPFAFGEKAIFLGTGTAFNATIINHIWMSSLDGLLYNGTPDLFRSSKLTAGKHTISFYVIDSKGEQSDSVNVSVIVNMRPYISINHPFNNTLLANSMLIMGSASDLDGNVDFVEISINGSEWIPVIGTTDWSFTINDSFRNVKLLSIEVRAWDGHHYSETVHYKLVIVSNTGWKSNHEGSESTQFPDEHRGIIVVCVVIAVWIISTTGLGFYTIFSLVFPIYSRLRSEDILDHKVRGRIIEYIRLNPGAHYTMIRKELNLSNGSTGYHLRVLETEGFIQSIRDGIYRKFYPYGMSIPRYESIGIEKEIINVVLMTPGISQRNLAKEIGLSQSTTSYHVNRLKNRNIVIASRRDGISLTTTFLEEI